MKRIDQSNLSILERDIDLYTAGIENAERRLRSCHPDHEQYWRDLAMKYAIVVNALREVEKHSEKYKQLAA